MLEHVEWEACLIEPRRDRALEQYVRGELGSVPPLVPYLVAAPWIARSLVLLNVPPAQHVDRHLADLIGLVVAEDNSCRFCYAMQRTMMRLEGFSTARIRELEEQRFTARLDPKPTLALEFARHISRADSRRRDDPERLRAAGWSREAVREIAFLAAIHVYFNRIATLPAVPVARLERMARLPGLGLLAPIFRRLMHRVHPRPDPLSLEACAGPLAYLVEAFAALPAGRGLRQVLDEACASPGLPLRSKLLVFAVVARAVGCPHAEGESVRLLGQDGMAGEAIAETLRHLRSPALDPIEAAIVPFARETVRYRPSEIQRRARELEPLLGRERLVELIGATALANAVCRLGVVVDTA
jgi:alkylhydroperoxidase family enzyme